MKLLSFNINGLRSVLGVDNNLDKFLLSLPIEADVICIQETKINHAGSLTPSLALLPNFHCYYSFHHDEHLLNKRLSSIGYAGVGSFYRKHALHPIGFEEGFTTIFNPTSSIPSRHPFDTTQDNALLKSVDAESRCVLTYHDGWVVVNTYCPNNADAPDRQQYRKLFYSLLWKRIVSLLEQGFSIVWAGDINISYHPIDHCDYALEYGKLCQKHGHHVVEEKIREYIENYVESNEEVGEDEEIAPTSSSHSSGTQAVVDGSSSSSKSSNNLFSNLLEFIEAFYAQNYHRRWLYRLLHFDEVAAKYHFRDSFRSLHPHAIHAYTCWNTQTNARQSNYGSRIDLIFVAGELFDPALGNLRESGILPNVVGSDHCPVYIDIDLPAVGSNAVTSQSKAIVPWNLKHLNGQQRLTDAFQKQQELPRVTKDKDQDISNVRLKGDSRGSNTDIKPSKKQKIHDFFSQPSAKKGSAEGVEEVIDMTQDDWIAGNSDIVFATSSSNLGAEGEIQQQLESTAGQRNDVVEVYVDDLSGTNTDAQAILQPLARQQPDAQSRPPSSAMPSITKSFISASRGNTSMQQAPAPLCKKHKEPCTIYAVTKKGPNRGRKFYLCSRPIGSSKDLNARCDHFEWLVPSKETSSLHAFLKK